MQFAFRDSLIGTWNNTVFKYIQLVINYISIDYLVEKNRGVLMLISIGGLSIMLLTMLVMILSGLKLKE